LKKITAAIHIHYREIDTSYAKARAQDWLCKIENFAIINSRPKTPAVRGGRREKRKI
jgi:hypothetical protein